MTEQLFDKIIEWQDATFPKATVDSKIQHLQREIAELIHAVNDEDHLIDFSKRRAVRYEFADCFFLLFGAAAKYGMDYTDICDAIYEKFTINKNRKWGSPDSQGVVEHKK